MIGYVVALQCEARPLIAHYRLKGRTLSNGFRIYERDAVQLIVSGVGKTAAAAATAFLQASGGDTPNRAWLNVGIAGHATKPVGDGLLAHKIIDAATTHCWYPPLAFTPPCATAAVLTVDRPVTDYPNEHTYDMEAAAFYATASRFSTGELVHSYKVVSDNAAAPANRISESNVTRLLESHLATIVAIADHLLDLAKQVADMEAPPPGYGALLERWRFSTYEQNQLLRLLQRARALDAQWNNEVQNLTHAKDVLAFLREKIGR